jgi:hypothetical protein
MEQNEFQLQAYSFQELAIAYAPALSVGSAVNRLSRWIRVSNSLREELYTLGWMPGNKQFTPMQVRTIVSYLGEP